MVFVDGTVGGTQGASHSLKQAAARAALLEIGVRSTPPSHAWEEDTTRYISDQPRICRIPPHDRSGLSRMSVGATAPAPTILFPDTTAGNLASRAALQKYQLAVDSLQRSVKPLTTELKEVAADPAANGDTPAAFLLMLNDKLDTTCTSLERGLCELRNSFRSSLPTTMLAAMLTVGTARIARLSVSMSSSYANCCETFLVAKTGDTPPTFALTCTTHRPPEFWLEFSCHEHDDPINIALSDQNLFVAASSRGGKRRALGGEPASYRYAFTFTDPSNIEKLIYHVAQHHRLRVDICNTPRGPSLMSAAGPGDGSVAFCSAAA